jgi:hypothetical protein
MAERCVGCNRLVRGQDVVVHGRMLMQRGAPVLEAIRPRCRKCLNELLRARPSKDRVAAAVHRFAVLRRI